MPVRDKWRQTTIADAVLSNAEMQPDKLFLTTEDGETTNYGQAAQRAVAVANSLYALGVRKGDTVASVMGNSQEVTSAWLGCSLLGALYVPINTHYVGTFLRHPIETARASVVIVDELLTANVCAVAAGIESLKHIVVAQRGVGKIPEYSVPSGIAIHQFESLLAEDSSSLKAGLMPQWNDMAAVLFTAGTTGPAKGNLITHNHVMALAGTTCDVRRIGPDDVLFSPLPMFHMQALVATCLCAQLTGCSAGLDWTFSVSKYWDRIRHYGVTNGIMLGPMLTMLVSKPPSPEDSTHPMRIAMCAPIPAEMHRPVEKRFNLRLVTAYGNTECGLPISSTWDEPPPPGYSGKVSAWADVRLVDDNDVEVADGEIGECVMRPREPHTVSEGYIGNPEATLRNWRNLWLHTGDLLRRNADGWYQFVDRKADYIRRRGENISTYEVEQAILSHPEVDDVAIVGQPSEFTEDEVKAWVVLQNGSQLTPEGLLDHCQEHMPYFALPRFVEFIEALPLSPIAKVLKYELRQRDNSTAWDREAAGYVVRRTEMRREAPPQTASMGSA